MMLSNIIKKSRSGESKTKKNRSDRCIKTGDGWFFHTREGFDVGPFDSRPDAHHALLYFAERSEWPNSEQLTDFINGCKMHAGKPV